jgi:hypothetical protein
VALPDADQLLLTIARAGTLDGDGEPTVDLGTQIPANLLKKIETRPFGMVKRIGGAAVDARYLDNATVDVQTWANDRGDAYAAIAAIRSAFLDSALDQTTTEHGHISRFVEVSGPSELRTADQADRVWRFQMTLSLYLRPAPGN